MNTLADLRRWAEAAPPGTTIPARALAEMLADLEGGEPAPAVQVEAAPAGQTWRSRLWTCAPETRLRVPDLVEALGVSSRHSIYRLTSEKEARKAERDPLPCRRLGGELVFRAGEVRRWLEANEEAVSGVAPRLRVHRGRS